MCIQDRTIALVFVAAMLCAMPAAAEMPTNDLDRQYGTAIRPLLERYCFDCHAGDTIEAEIDFAAFPSFDQVRQRPETWSKVLEMVDSGQMPPVDADQPIEEERRALSAWTREFLSQEAQAHAGDPGPHLLRRLNNAQYTYTIRDLTGVATLDPAREFPTDGAAGEGFTNASAALVMSPALIAKYLDAAKDIANHAVLLPDGFRFSPSTSRRDWTEETLARIRQFYGRHTSSGGGTAVNLQGIQFETNRDGRLPIERYVAALLAHREGLRAGQVSPEGVAKSADLNGAYLARLWRALSVEQDGSSPIMDRLRSIWKKLPAGDGTKLTDEIARWQQTLWKFNSIGHLGRHLGSTQGPERWMEAVTPLSSQQELRFKLGPPDEAGDITVYLVATDAGDGGERDSVVWKNPRIVMPGGGELPLRDVRATDAVLREYRGLATTSIRQCLEAADWIESQPGEPNVNKAAERFDADATLLAAWLEWLGIGGAEAQLGDCFTEQRTGIEGYEFVTGWVGPDSLSVMANSSDQHVRIPGNLDPHAVVVHPSPSRRVVIAWKSPLTGTVEISGRVQHAHPECGNGTTWSLELQRRNSREQLSSGIAQGGTPRTIGPLEGRVVQSGDLIRFVIGPRDGNHSCDLTRVDLSIRAADREWDLARDVASDLLAANPHADALGNQGIWHFASEPDRGLALATIPTASLLSRWRGETDSGRRRAIAAELGQLVAGGFAELPDDSPDKEVCGLVGAANGPLLTYVRDRVLREGRIPTSVDDRYGLDPREFGRNDRGANVDANDLHVQAPSVKAIRLPGYLATGGEFVATVSLDSSAGSEGSAQVDVLGTPPESLEVSSSVPFLANEGGPAHQRIEAACAEIRDLFPASLCYTQIVPVDEVITLNLFYREDDHLQRLMLNDEEAAELDRLWDELRFVSQEPLLLAAAYEQLVEYATQDRPDKVVEFAPMRAPIESRADAYRQDVVAAEPIQVNALVAFAERAYRRRLSDREQEEFRDLYASLRQQELPHDEAFRLLLARLFIAPAFLYRLETPPEGQEPRPVADHELASRLSYLLWSSLPDEELQQAASQHTLQDPEHLLAQTRRMMRDAKAARLAREFAAQWLQIYEFDQLDEKSERQFPEFAELRGEMYEESLQFLADIFQNDRSILDLLDANYTFCNDKLARHYGLPNVTGSQWQRVEGVREHGRGGILTQATILAKQSGASRTSPILRGNWVSEVLLGEKLPRPPKNVPQLAETPPAGLTERQMIERHSRDAACAKCHARIDPFGFALEEFDAIGRYRQRDAEGHAIDARTMLPDGTAIDGWEGLRDYVSRQRRDDFVHQFNRKLLGYALGRSVQLSDGPLLDQMASELQVHDYRFSAALETLVQSRQFREIRGREVDSEGG